jgi:hypothetical protein
MAFFNKYFKFLKQEILKLKLRTLVVCERIWRITVFYLSAGVSNISRGISWGVAVSMILNFRKLKRHFPKN